MQNQKKVLVVSSSIKPLSKTQLLAVKGGSDHTPPPADITKDTGIEDIVNL